MGKIPITKAGFAKLKKDLEILKNKSIPENIRDIEVARAHGDLSENAEYAAAKERQSFLHGKVQELENNLALSNIIELKGLKTNKVVFGCYVTIEDSDSGEEIKYQLVGPFESDINQNKISTRIIVASTATGPEAATIIGLISISLIWG